MKTYEVIFQRAVTVEVDDNAPQEQIDAEAVKAVNHMIKHADYDECKAQHITSVVCIDSDSKYHNDYRCPRCYNEWSETWDCGCDSDCPACQLRRISPIRSILLEE